MSKQYLVTQDQSVDGVALSGDAIHYATCATAAATAAKTAALNGFKLGTGAWAAIKFTVTNAAANPTLNINGTGAKAIRYRNAAVSAGALAANRIYLVVYDGTYWQVVGDLDTNTTYSAATTSAAGLMSAADKTKLNNSDIVFYQGLLNTSTYSVSKDLPSGKTKCLIIASAYSSFTTISPSGSIALSSLSTSMSSITNTVLANHTEDIVILYGVDTAGKISLQKQGSDRSNYNMVYTMVYFA